MTNRRDFLKTSGLATAALTLPHFNILAGAKYQSGILGHGSHKYKLVEGWGVLDFSRYPVKDCHEMVQDSKGRLILITNETKNNILIYDKSGKLLDSWGDQFPGGHGLTLSNENGEEFLFITDHDRHQVYKTTLDGKILMTKDFPKESGLYQNEDQFKPTEVAVAPNGDFYVADGYGSQYIVQYSAKGELIRIFGGNGDGDENFQNAHGICLDNRDPNNPTLLITARAQNTLKRFTLDGKFIEKFPLPGAMINRPVIHGENVYFSVLMSGGKSESGFVLILDKNNKLISCPGGSTPDYVGDTPKSLYQVVKLFKHPHDVCVDDDENIYVPQWNSGKTYPIKLERV